MDIRAELQDEISSLSKEQYDKWVMEWIDPELLKEMVDAWETETVEYAVSQLKERPRFYKITSVCKGDILALYEGNDNYDDMKKQIKKITINDMTWLASKMSGAYCECCFHSDIKQFFEDYLLENLLSKKEDITTITGE